MRIDSETRRAAAPALFSLERKKLSAKELTLFTRQASTLIQVSPIEEALRTIARQSEKPHVRKVIDRVHAGIIEGRRLAEAMGGEPRRNRKSGGSGKSVSVRVEIGVRRGI